MFKDFDNIEIELFNYCNRTCWFCPNSFLDRKTSKEYMSEETYLRLLQELKENSFTGKISYSRYNEPFADSIFFERLKQAREIFPDGELHTNTNGDYLNPSILKTAEQSGLNSVNIQLYPQEEYNRKEIFQVYERLSTKCDISARLVVNRADRLEWHGKLDTMKVKFVGRNFEVNGTDRGGSLDRLRGKIRTKPCFRPSKDIYIDWNGNVMPCCNLRSDYSEHEWYILGNINHTSLVNCLFNDHAKSFREEMLTDCAKKGACRTCVFH